MMRLDRLAEAVDAGIPLTASGATLRVLKPDWARFAVPGEAQLAQ
jgi:hypothetical protein